MKESNYLHDTLLYSFLLSLVKCNEIPFAEGDFFEMLSKSRQRPRSNEALLCLLFDQNTVLIRNENEKSQPIKVAVLLF